MKNISWSSVKAIPGILIAAFLIPAAASSAERVLEGRVTKVRDVDTIVVAGTPVRLNGLDGPEVSTQVGKAAALFMGRLVSGKVITCELNGERTYDRWVGVCFLDGQDIAAVAVSQGYALDCPRYSGGRYRKYETAAARSKIQRSKYC
ncbi:thermonuclease family protein [Aquicoccus sp. SU-CL01552]|uniref:thermonuclease family protein n=1 Tax=Aquicoccus sp. SU-CL01552 TaxID=3127656 RepID=UPI00310C81CD